jgi:hypothetical protein
LYAERVICEYLTVGAAFLREIAKSSFDVFAIRFILCDDVEKIHKRFIKFLRE